MDTPITIATFQYPHEAAILQAKLELEGIQCYLQDQNVVVANPFYSNAVGGVKLQINDSDLERAKPIVDEYNSANNLNVEPSAQQNIIAADSQEKGAIVCPSCGSDDVAKDKTPPGIIILAVFFIGLPLLIFGKKYHCFNCGQEFKLK
jgi:DNA-directed RNA polymerase subunit RPC12/RpoP